MKWTHCKYDGARLRKDADNTVQRKTVSGTMVFRRQKMMGLHVIENSIVFLWVMSTARRVIDQVAESDDLSQAIRQREHLILCMRDPAFVARSENPRKAITGDILKITRRMKHPPGSTVHIMQLTRDAEDIDRPWDRGTRTVRATQFQGIPPQDSKTWGRPTYGHSVDYWNYEPHEWGTQEVELVGHGKRHELGRLWTPRPGNPGYDLG